MTERESWNPATHRSFFGSTGLPCADCRQPHDEYAVDSDLWNLIIRPDGRETDHEYLCLACFHRRVSKYLTTMRDERDRMIRQEQWVFNYARRRIWTLESALRWIGSSNYLGKRWVRRRVSSALDDMPQLFALVAETSEPPRDTP